VTEARAAAAAGPPRPRRVLVVGNPSAGGDPEGLAAAVAAGFEDGGEVRAAWPTSAAEAVALVAEEVAEAASSGRPFGIVCAVGGDGTCRDVAEGLVRSLGRWPGPGERSGELLSGAEATRREGDAVAEAAPPALLVVPAGTGNSVYRALWGDRGFAEVVREVRAGRARVREVDLARLAEEDRAVLLGATTGFLAEVAREARALGAIRGRERYQHAAAAAAPRLAPYPGRVEVDGRVVAEGALTLVAVGGARHRAGTFELLPRSVLDDGLLDACAIGPVGPERFAELSALVAKGGHLGEPEVTYAKGRAVVLERTDGEPLGFEHDGDYLEPPSRAVRLEVLPRALPVLAPPRPLAG
jgi:diacylglycerol kinase (ATP)